MLIIKEGENNCKKRLIRQIQQTVCATGAVRALGVRKTAVAYALCAVFSHPHS